MTPLEIAQKCAEIMWKNDQASKGLGMRLEKVGPGKAEVSLVIEDKHLNGHGICHGGFIFTLADSAFAFACNTYNQSTVAQNNTITFLLPAHKGQRLMAKATEISRSGRSGIYDVSVINEKNEAVAEFRGHSRTISGRHFQEKTK